MAIKTRHNVIWIMVPDISELYPELDTPAYRQAHDNAETRRLGMGKRLKIAIAWTLAAAIIGLSACQAAPVAEPAPRTAPPSSAAQQSQAEKKPAPALSAAERDLLAKSMDSLSHAWDQASVDAANSVLFKEYVPGVWREFFAGFFETHPFTDSLENYLNYPVFHWSTPGAQDNLQQGLTTALMGYAGAFTEKYSASLPETVANDSLKRQTLMNTHRFLNELAGGSSYASRTSRLPDELRNDVFRFYVDYVNRYPQYFKGDKTITQPYMAAIKAQVAINLRDAVPQSEENKAQVSAALGLSGERLDIWNSSSVLILDNHGLDNSQLSVIGSILQSVPKNLYDLGAITVNDFLGNTGDKYLWFRSRYAINVFGDPVGKSTENSFPADVQPGYADIYSIVVAHELNHTIDAYLSQNSAFAERKKQLLAQAGDEPRNYLRSMFAPGFFTKNPQEFFASMSNEWFTDSEKTIELALNRFDKGVTAPLNQALFFADTYSKGDVSYFYRMDASGNLSQHEAGLGRDGRNRIVGLSYGNRSYSFQLDGASMVTSYTGK